MKPKSMINKTRAVAICMMLLLIIMTGCTTKAGEDSFDISALQGKKLIAITVDDGPDGSGTEAYIQIAKDFSIPLTFFVIGKNIENNSQQLQEMLDAGCEIGNHSYSHDYLSVMEPNAIINEIKRTNDLIVQYAPDATISFVRAPYFSYSETLYENVKFPLIDAQLQENTNAQETLNTLMNAKDGDIVLLHSSRADSREALMDAIPYLQEQGFAFVTISQLFHIHEVEPIEGTVYKHIGKNTINDYTSSENLYKGEAFASGDWNIWDAAVELDATVIASMTENQAIMVEYKASAGPCFILMDWNDGGPGWVQLTPSFDDGTKALFTYQDLFTYYNFGENLSTVDGAQVRPWGADIIVKEVSLLSK